MIDRQAVMDEIRAHVAAGRMSGTVAEKIMQSLEDLALRASAACRAWGAVVSVEREILAMLGDSRAKVSKESGR